jgi:transposase
MSEPDPPESKRPSGTGKPFQRRVRYSGKNPRHYSQKYKELDPQRDPETIAKVLSSGKTPAGQHRPILVDEVLEALDLKPGDRGADATFGYGGHSEAILGKILPGGQLLSLDVDSVQLPRSEQRLRDLGYSDQELVVKLSNYAGLKGALEKIGRWTLEIVKRSDMAKGFEIIPRRWVVERTFAWLGRCRRKAKDWEETIASAEAWLLISHIRRVVRLLARV